MSKAKYEYYTTHQKKVHAYIEKEFPKFFTGVNGINFFSVFLEMPLGHEEIYNRGNKKGFV